MGQAWEKNIFVIILYVCLSVKRTEVEKIKSTEDGGKRDEVKEGGREG